MTSLHSHKLMQNYREYCAWKNLKMSNADSLRQFFKFFGNAREYNRKQNELVARYR